MERFLPKNNKHTLHSILFSIVVIFVSAGIAYGAQKHFSLASSADSIAPVQDAGQSPPSQPTISQEITAPAPQIVAPAPVVATSVVVLPAPAVRSKDPATLLQEAKMYTQPQITTGKYIDISLKYQNMVIFQDGIALDAYRISSGEWGHPTPVGTFAIQDKSLRAWSKLYGLWMPFWMAFLPDGEMGIHELPIWPNGYQEGAAHLGTPVSHGCVRLGVGPAERVYNWADLGTPVIIHQ